MSWLKCFKMASSSRPFPLSDADLWEPDYVNQECVTSFFSLPSLSSSNTQPSSSLYSCF